MPSTRNAESAYPPKLSRLGASLLAALAIGVVSLACAAAPQDPFSPGPAEADQANPFGSGSGESDPFGSGEEQADPFGAGDNPFGEGAQPDHAPNERQPAPAPAQPRAHATRPAANAGAQPIIWAGPHAQQNARVRAALDKQLPSVGLDFVDTPLAEVVEFLRDEYRIEIQLDRPALNDIGIDAEENVSVNIRNVPLKSALRLMLDQFELDYVVTGGILLITSAEEAETRLQIAVYPVADLVASHGQAEDFDSLIDTLISIIASESWADNGGGEADIRPLPPGRLVISQTERVHEEIAALLDALRKAAQRQPTTAAAPTDGVYTRAYELAIPANVDPERLVARLMDLLRQAAPSATREGADAEGRAYVLAALADRVVVRNDRQAHQEVEQLLSDVGLLRRTPRMGGLGGGGLGGGFGGGGGAF